MSEKLVTKVHEEINDAAVMVDWWNEAVMEERYENIVRLAVMDDGGVLISAYDNEMKQSYTRLVSLADFKAIDGVLSVDYDMGDLMSARYRVSVAETYDDGWMEGYAENLDGVCWAMGA